MEENKTFLYEYVWIDASNQPRSKIRVMETPCYSRWLKFDYSDEEKNAFIWNYDGSSCGQASTEHSEITLIPVAFYKNPYLDRDRGYLILCESVDDHRSSAVGSNYQYAKRIFDDDRVKAADFWFGIEQEYFFLDVGTKFPYGFTPYDHEKNKSLYQGDYYCGVGGAHIDARQRKVAEEHAKVCLSMNIPISGINVEVAPSQWEYQVGIAHGIEAAHHLWVSRYMLKKIAESYGLDVSFHPKPICEPVFENHWNGSGAHVNISTRDTRNAGGYHVIIDYMKKFAMRHREHMVLYGAENEKRLTGNHETANMESFTYGVGCRGSSVRIPNQTGRDLCGYFEDRRPAANMDPYLVCGIIAETIFLI